MATKDGFPPKIRNEAKVFTLTVPFHNHIGSHNKTRKVGGGGIQMGKEELKLSSFTEDATAYVNR